MTTTVRSFHHQVCTRKSIGEYIPLNCPAWDTLLARRSAGFSRGKIVNSRNFVPMTNIPLCAGNRASEKH
jgi:hypothetical protein